MKSFTAECRLGAVKVHMPDDQPPRVMHNGHVVAVGVPTTVSQDGKPALSFRVGVGFDELVCVPIGQTEQRQARSVVSNEGVQMVDVAVFRSPGVFAADGLPVVWGARLSRSETVVRGFTFDGGVQTLVEWSLDMVPAARRPCCGRSR